MHVCGGAAGAAHAVVETNGGATYRPIPLCSSEGALPLSEK